MRILFVTYCFGTETGPTLERGQVLIGVYKRGLRVALELCSRGHDVYFFCSGRENFHDAMTAEAERKMTFVEWDLDEDTPEEAAVSRQRFLDGLREIAPDLVVIGEAPLAGALLETALCAAQLEIPCACLDNSYGDGLSKLFCDQHGPLFDGVVLTGPSSFHAPDGPDFLLEVPPYMVSAPDEVRDALRQHGLSGERLITVLAYDRNVEALGASLFARLADPELEAVFITHRQDECRERLSTLPEELRKRAVVLPTQPDRHLFGYLQIARLAVGKCAFMQVTESLSLLTPIIGFYFTGDFHLRCIPEVCHRFAHSSDDLTADDETVAAARRFLAYRPEDMLSVHDGSLHAAARASDFLERIPGWPRRDTAAEAAQHHGLQAEDLLAALRDLHPGDTVQLDSIRCAHIRNPENQRIHALVCHYRVDEARHVERLWWHRFPTPEHTRAEAERAAAPASGRGLVRVDADRCHLFERDTGQPRLPPVDDV